MSQMVLLEAPPENPPYALAYQLKEKLGLAGTPIVQKYDALPIHTFSVLTLPSSSP